MIIEVQTIVRRDEFSRTCDFKRRNHSRYVEGETFYQWKTPKICYKNQKFLKFEGFIVGDSLKDSIRPCYLNLFDEEGSSSSVEYKMCSICFQMLKEK